MYKFILTTQFIRLITAHFFYWVNFYMFVPILPRHYHLMGLSDFEIGLIVGAVSLSGLLFRIPAGKALNRFGAVPVLGLGLVFSMIAITGYFFSNSAATAVLSGIIQGFGLACYAGTSLTMASLMFEDKYVVDVFAVISLAGMAGVSLSTALANWIYDLGGLRYIVFIGLTSAAISLITFPKHPVIIAKIKESAGLAISKIIANPKVYIPTLSIFITNFCFSGSMTFLPLLMITKGMNDFNTFFVSYSLIVIFFRIITVRLCHSFEIRRLEGLAVIAAALTMLTASVADNWQSLILCGTFMGISMGVGFPVMGASVTGGVAPIDRAMALSLFTSFSDLGMIAGAAGLAVAVGFLGYSSTFLLAGIFSLIYALSHWLWLVKKLAAIPNLKGENL